MRNLLIGIVLMFIANTSFAQWIFHETGSHANLYDVSFASSKVGWAVGDSATILKTIDGGNSWQKQISGAPTKVNFHCVQAMSEDHVWASGGWGGLYCTTDGGKTWVAQKAMTAGTFLFSMYDDSVGFGGAAGGPLGTGPYMYRTLNGGNKWTTTEIADNENENCYYSYSKDTIFMGCYGEGIKISIDGGQTFAPVGGNGAINDIYFVNQSLGFAVGLAGAIYRTTTGGLAWAPVNNPNTGTTFLTHNGTAFINDLVGWITPSEGRTLKTIDGGATWTFEDNEPNFRWGICAKNGHAWVACKNGLVEEYVPADYKISISDDTLAFEKNTSSFDTFVVIKNVGLSPLTVNVDIVDTTSSYSLISSSDFILAKDDSSIINIHFNSLDTTVKHALLRVSSQSQLKTTQLIGKNLNGEIELGVNKIENKFEFNILPNPISNNANFKIKTTENLQDVKMEFFDFLGRQIFPNPVSINENSFSTNGLKTGLYFCRISNQKKSGVKSFVIVSSSDLE